MKFAVAANMLIMFSFKFAFAKGSSSFEALPSSLFPLVL